MATSRGERRVASAGSAGPAQQGVLPGGGGRVDAGEDGVTGAGTRAATDTAAAVAPGACATYTMPSLTISNGAAGRQLGTRTTVNVRRDCSVGQTALAHPALAIEAQ